MKHNLKNEIFEIVRIVPKGQVISYKQIALKIKNKNYSRLVGKIIATNKNWPEIPCHRVIYHNGKIGRWSLKGGSKRKVQLLKTEGIVIKNNRVPKEFFIKF
ncbi:MAG TPA: MGMT family protein [Candidatus Paceibacterota bacterium]|jgi:O-6-methylguanine DNA methyltransferase|nr:MGMT family protein [Candidatus Paceibacterota bacterium]HRS47889.1 MGMT family protein [Candidatus Paceibacterota bacterium]